MSIPGESGTWYLSENMLFKDAEGKTDFIPLSKESIEDSIKDNSSINTNIIQSQDISSENLQDLEKLLDSLDDKQKK